MSENKILPTVSNSDIANNGVQALADRPNRTNQYGTSGLTAKQLKEWFDKLVVILAEKINFISDALDGETTEEVNEENVKIPAGRYIKVSAGDYTNLYDLIEAMKNGDFANAVLKLYPDVNKEKLVPLQGVIDAIAKSLAAREDEDTTLQNNIDTEKTERENADTALDGRVTANTEALGYLKTLVGKSLPEGVNEQTVIAYIESVAGELASEITNRGTAISEALKTARGYADTKKGEAQQYTDGKVTDLQGKISTAKENAISESKTYTDNKVADLVNGAPTTLDTLKEIADAFSENKEVVEALDVAIGSKVGSEAYNAKVAELDAAIGSKVGTEAYNAKVAELEGDMAGKLDAKFEAIADNKIRLVVAYPDGSIKAEKIATGGSY